MEPFILHPDFVVVVDGATNWLSKVNPTVTLKHVPTNLKVTSNGNCSSFTNKKTAYVQLLAKLESKGVNIEQIQIGTIKMPLSKINLRDQEAKSKPIIPYKARFKNDVSVIFVIMALIVSTILFVNLF